MPETPSRCDREELGLALLEAYPEENPLDVEIERLRELVAVLEGASMQGASDELLEEIRMVWYSHYSAYSC